jgi:hypothetical protein
MMVCREDADQKGLEVKELKDGEAVNLCLLVLPLQVPAGHPWPQGA